MARSGESRACRNVSRIRRSGAALSGRLPARETVTGRDGKEYPSQIERQPRGKSEGASRDESSSGGSGGGFAKGKGDGGAFGGSTAELEREARAMIRKGEINPFELRTLVTANALDYADTVINLLGTMRPDDPQRTDGLLRIRHWIDQTIGGNAPIGAGETVASV